jgi:hypothetical protein
MISPDLDFHHRLDFSIGHDHFRDIAADDLFLGDGNRRNAFGELAINHARDDHEGEQEKENDLFFAFRLCH